MTRHFTLNALLLKMCGLYMEFCRSEMIKVFHSGKIRTFEDSQPVAEAMAIRGTQIIALGQGALEMLENDEVQQIDLAGQTVIPGLVDVHNHHNLGGTHELFEFHADPTTPIDQFLEELAVYVRDLPGDGWVVGGSVGSGWIEQVDSAEALAKLDAITGNRPTMLTDDSKHNRWVNSAAMRAAGIDSTTPDPRGGQISRDENGNPTGWLIEAGGMMVEHAKNAVQPLTIEQLAQASEHGVKTLNSFGFTAFQDAATSLQIMEGLQLLDREERLNSWVVSSAPVEEFIFGFQPVGEEIIEAMEKTRSVHHRPDFIKIFLDGVPPARTAAFIEPYIDAAGLHTCSHGHMTMPFEELESWLFRTARQGISAKIHCTGDASVRAVLDVVERVRREGFKDVKYHIAHGQFVSPEDIPRFAELDVTADISPALWYPCVITESFKAVLDPKLAERVHPNRDLLEANARIAGGSDWPVSVSPNPWPEIYGLITRRNPFGDFPGELWPEQAMTSEEAIRAYTLSAAEAAGLDDVAGSLKVGKSADFVVLPIDPVDAEPQELINLLPNQTWFAGRCVYSASSDA